MKINVDSVHIANTYLLRYAMNERIAGWEAQVRERRQCFSQQQINLWRNTALQASVQLTLAEAALESATTRLEIAEAMEGIASNRVIYESHRRLLEIIYGEW